MRYQGRDEASKEKRPHEVLLDSDRPEMIGKLEKGAVSPLVAIGAVILKAGTNEDGESNVPALAHIYDLLHILPTNVGAERAQMVADTLKHEGWKPRPSSLEWDPDHRAEETARREERGLPRR